MQVLPLSAVTLLSGPMRTAQDVDLRYVLDLDVDRLLAPLRREAGLDAIAESYGNWESGGLDGHIAGHWLSACAALVAATGDERVRDRLGYAVREIARFQDIGGDGYVGGVPDGRRLWSEVAGGTVDVSGFGLGGRWVPWYNLHKLFAGLLDVARLTDDSTAELIVERLADWWLPIGAALDEAAFESMLSAEFGGMNGVFAELAERTGRADFAAMARRFSHRAVLGPLLEGRDALTGLHANTQMPKAIGWARLGSLEHDEVLLDAARLFWSTVATRRSVAIGGNSTREHFHPADDFSSQVEEREGPETCNTVNMVKLSRLLHEEDGDPRYLDFAERALFNHLLSAQHPEHGGFVYFTSMRPSHYRVYSQVDEGFWCCVGSGLEAQARYGELVFSADDDTIAVNLFVPAVARWAARDVRLEVSTRLPEEDVVRVAVSTPQAQAFRLQVRVPAWLAGDPAWSIGGAEVVPSAVEDGFAVFDRTWSDGDVLVVRLPMAVRAERLSDGSDWVAFAYGPVVLAAATSVEGLDGLRADDSRMGHVAHGPLVPLADTPVVVHDGDPAARVRPVSDGGARFLLRPEDDAEPIELRPFASVHDSRYTVYWPDARRGREGERRSALAAEDTAVLRLDERTLDVLTAGEQQPEAEHDLASESSRVGMVDGRRFRSATGWFSYRFADPGGEATVLRVTCRRADEERRCVLELDGARIADVVVPAGEGDLDAEYAFESDGGSVESLEVRFVAQGGAPTPDVVVVRLLR